MIYKKLTPRNLRSYKSMGNWGIGANIFILGDKFRATIDVCFGNHIDTVSSADFGSMQGAKGWNTRNVKKMISGLEEWSD